MSRIGKLPVSVPSGVTVTVSGSSVVVKGQKGSLQMDFPRGVQVVVEENLVKVDSSQSNLHGLVRALVNNMVKGVSEGWSKILELSGTGFRASTNGSELNLALGFSHPVVVKAPEGITFEVKENKIVVLGADKVKVGEVAANIRRLKPADPYKAKGFKYEGEVIRRKAGKAAKAGATAAK